MFKQFGIINSYTLEATFYAAFNPKNQYLQSQKRKPVEDDQQVKGSELITVGYIYYEACCCWSCIPIRFYIYMKLFGIIPNC